jgi:hypothetical protein
MSNKQSILLSIIEYELKKINNSINLPNKQNIKIILNQDEINYLNNLIKDKPELFLQINEQINSICQDGMIDYHDVPQIILLITNIFKGHLVENIIENINIISVVKFISETILHSGIMPLSDLEINLIDKIIDTSINLLEINTDIIKKEEEYCFSIFGWKIK